MQWKRYALGLVAGSGLALGGGLMGCETQDPAAGHMHQDPGMQQPGQQPAPQQPAPQQPAPEESY